MYKIAMIGKLWGWRLAWLALIIWIGSVLAFRLDILHFGVIFQSLIVAVGVAALALLLSLIALCVPKTPKTAKTFVALVLALVLTILPLNAARKAQNVPPIHDISTNLDDPPQYEYILKLRRESDNSLDSDPKVHNLQREHYPDITSYVVDVPPTKAFAQSLSLAILAGWDIVHTDSDSGKIEATALTALFGFSDDIVLRVRPHNDGSVLDIRSASRIGVSDLGVNARRIRMFLHEWDDYTAE